MRDVFCVRLCGDRFIFEYLGGLLSTFILLKNFNKILRLFCVDLENTCSSVIVCEAYMSFLSLLKNGHSHSMWCAVSSGSSTS